MQCDLHTHFMCQTLSVKIKNNKNLTLWETSKSAPINPRGLLLFTSYSGFTLGTPVFTHYTSAMRRYAPHDIGSDKQQ